MGRHCQAPEDFILADRVVETQHNPPENKGNVRYRQNFKDPRILIILVWVLTTRAATLKSPGT